MLNETPVFRPFAARASSLHDMFLPEWTSYYLPERVLTLTYKSYQYFKLLSSSFHELYPSLLVSERQQVTSQVAGKDHN